VGTLSVEEQMIHIQSSFQLCPCGVVHKSPVNIGLPRVLPSAADLRPYYDLYLTSTAKNLMLEAMDESVSTGMKYGSLHTAYSTTGTNEVTGGSPAYARKALTWAAASGGSKALQATLPTWDVPASTTVAWVGLYDAVTSGNFLGMMPAGAGTLQPAAAEASGDISSDTVNAKAHGFTAGTTVVFWGTLPTGISVGTIYYVISSGLTSDVFKVSTSSGGSAVDLTGTAPFVFFVQKCVPEVFAGQGTYALTSGSIDLGAVA